MRFILAFLLAFIITPALAQCVPGGRLTLDPGNPVMWRDTTSATIYYGPTGKDGNQVPIFDGTTLQCIQFTSGANDNIGWSLSLIGLVAGTIVDAYASYSGLIFVPWVSGVPIVVDALYDGIVVNGTVMSGCPLYQCTFLGTVHISAAGQATFTVSLGLNREQDVWNFYHQEPYVLKITDPTTTPYLDGAGDAQGDGSIRSAMGCVNRNCNFSATTLIGRIGPRISAEFFYDVRGLHGNAAQSTPNTAHVSAIGLDGWPAANPPPCDIQSTTNFEYYSSPNYIDTGLTKVAACAPDPSAIVGSHTFYLDEVQLDGYGQSWITSYDIMGFVKGLY